MKILQVNSFYYNRGGDCTHMFALTTLLEENGHTVIPFSMVHPLNFESHYSKYWPSYIDFREKLKEKGIKNVIEVLLRTIYSFESRKCIKHLLNKEKPDIVHLHNIMHHITPSILGEIKKHNIPVVWTLHDYSIICPNTLFLTENGEICEACKKCRFFMAPIKRCKKNSFAASMVAMFENYVHRVLGVFRYVDMFISPSNFLRKKFIEYGIKNRIVTLNNFIDTEKFEPVYDSDRYYIYFGRISHIKGINVLIEAAQKNPSIQLKIVGDGEVLAELKKQEAPNIEFCGFKSRLELRGLISRAMFAVVPSQCYENFSYSIIESMAMGKPVIGSDMGGIPEQIDDGETGFIFRHTDVDQLASLINKLAIDENLRKIMGQKARIKAEEKYSKGIYYKNIMEIYNSVKHGE